MNQRCPACDHDQAIDNPRTAGRRPGRDGIWYVCWVCNGTTTASSLGLVRWEAREILDRKKAGIDCDELESCVLMRCLDVCDTPMAQEIADRFPMEWDQWCGHVEDGEADHVNPRDWGPELSIKTERRLVAAAQGRIERNLA